MWVMIEKLRMWSMLAAIGFRAPQLGRTTTKSLRWRLISRSDVKARRAVPKPKKRHVESVTRLPTKRMATACWDFIVVKTARLQTAPLLDFFSLQAANRIIYQQDIHKALWMSWGLFQPVRFIAQSGRSDTVQSQIVAICNSNQPPIPNVSNHQLADDLK